MVVVMNRDATDADIERVAERVREVGGEAFVSRGTVHTIIGLVGDTSIFRALDLDNLPGVDHLIHVGKPYKMVARSLHPARPSSTGRPSSGADVHAHRRSVRRRGRSRRSRPAVRQGGGATIRMGPSSPVVAVLVQGSARAVSDPRDVPRGDRAPGRHQVVDPATSSSSRSGPTRCRSVPGTCRTSSC
jgi:hypothetical protein